MRQGRRLDGRRKKNARASAGKIRKYRLHVIDKVALLCPSLI